MLHKMLDIASHFDQCFGDMSEDSLDARLIQLLVQNARAPTAQLARKLGVARSTVQARLERLEQSGVITGYSARVGASDNRVRAHVLIGIAPQAQAAVEARLKKIDAVASLLSVSGPYDLIAEMAAATTRDLDAALDQVRAIEGVRETMSSIILSRKFDRG